MSKRKPHNDYAGYVAERKVTHARGGHLVLIDATASDMDPTDGRWVILWEPAGRMAQYSNQKTARRDLKSAAELIDADLWGLLLTDEERGVDS